MAVRRVEMFGPMGAGKSTIYRTILTLPGWKRMGPLVRTAREEKRSILFREAYQHSPFSWILLRVLTLIPTVDASLIRDKISSLGRKALAQHAGQMEEFIQCVLNARSVRTGDFDLALLRSTWFVRDLADVCLFGSYSGRRLLLHDESLLQRGLSLSFDEQQGKAFLRRYSELVVLPDLALHVTIPVSASEERIRKRQRGNFQNHLQHAVDAHERSYMIAETLQNRGCKVITLDGLEDPMVNAKNCLVAIQEVLES